jgi:gliding motility-associated-like protein
MYNEDVLNLAVKSVNLKFVARTFALIALMLCTLLAAAQPSNDNCANANTISIANSGYGIGAFTSAIVDISAGTVQSGETFAPAILVAGQIKKSVWFKFSIPTTRSVKVTVDQSGTGITAGDVGFTVYKAAACLPANAQISSKLTPLERFGKTEHPCVEPGDYLVQVSSKADADGKVFVKVETAQTNAAYDQPAQAYDFGGITQGIKTVRYTVDCQSTEDASERCSVISNASLYTKTSWHVFKTPAYFDYVAMLLASGNGSFPSGETKIGYKVYKGDARSTPISSLTGVTNCDSFVTNGYTPDYRIYRCGELQPNTTYSVQLFFPETFTADILFALNLMGTAPTNAPQPILSSIPASNILGTLPSSPSGVTTTVSDQFGCNSRHSLHPCNPPLPAGGYLYQNTRFNLSTFFTFKLANAANVYFYVSSTSCYSNFLFRVYKKAPTNNCAIMDSANMVGEWRNNLNLGCLDPGEYTLQVLGTDTAQPKHSYYYASLQTTSTPLCMLTNLGEQFSLNIVANSVIGTSRFSLNKAGAYDPINAVNGSLQPLVKDVTYTAVRDTFGCKPTVLPDDVLCSANISQALYRQFKIADSGIVALGGWNGHYNWNKVYAGDINALAAAQNAYSSPAKISGLTPQTACISWQGCWGNSNSVCLAPGTYTFASFSDGRYSNSNVSEAPTFQFRKLETLHSTYKVAQNMGNIIDTMAKYGRTSVQSDVDFFSCRDNAVPINGVGPCYNYTKAIYRQFYLSATSLVSINIYYPPNCGDYNYSGIMKLFSGKATDGLEGLTPVGWPYDCFTQAHAPTCGALAPGWYTVVSYGTGATYGSTTQNGSGDVGAANQFSISITPACPAPKYNRPHKAAIDTLTKKPFLIEWGANGGHTAAYPKTDKTYTLPTENFDCTVDAPFTYLPPPACGENFNKVAFYVFQLTQESFVQINLNNFNGAVYAGNIRTDSAKFATTATIQTCMASFGSIQICRMQPGYYTLAVFQGNTSSCTNVTPSIYIDRVGYSRFDHANNAYDFGTVPPDSLYHNGKVGDVNPLDPGRAPSNDFIYCTTGSQKEDPQDPVCMVEYKENIYSPATNNALYTSNSGWTYPRRNLWYTFVVKEGGYIKVQVNNKTIDKGYKYRFAIYKSNVDGSKPFSEVVSSGGVDSTIFQGLSLVTMNPAYYCDGSRNEVQFYREPCSSHPERYYILVENPNSYPYEVGMKPNSQLEVSILVDSVNAIQPKFDYYSSAGNIGSALGPGTFKGATDNYSCATRDAADPVEHNNLCGNKTLWYKFTTTVTGHVRFRMVSTKGQTTQSEYSWTDMALYRELKKNDSTRNGLSFINGSNAGYYDPATNAYWGTQCVSPGTYYLLLTGCNKVDEFVYPEIIIDEEAGDFCSAPVVASLNGPGTKTASAIIDCHTIGTDYGEFNPTLTCPAGALKGEYKTTWFRIDVKGNDTLDVTTYIDEKTNAQPANIKYRMMTGNCGAMQEQSCVEDALTRNTYKCLGPGSYFIQVFTPVKEGWQPVNGSIDLHVSAVKHVDTCGKLNNCLSNATFTSEFDCAKDDAVTFVNYSTYGSSIQYKWDFGVNGQTSTEVAPRFSFPALATEKTYNVKLTVTNSSCGGTSTYTLPVTIPGRPAVSLGADTILCSYGSSLTLDAASWSGTTYRWNTGETTPSIKVTSASASPNLYWVEATYKGCIKRDTISVAINPINQLKQTSYLCGEDSVQLNSARGFGETYLWSTGSTAPSIYAKEGGMYVSQLKWNSCTIKDSFTVIRAIAPFQKEDTTVCLPFASFTLNATAPGVQSYQWQNGAGGATHKVSSPGTYWVRVNYPTCSLQDTFVVRQSPPVVRTTKDTTICGGQTYLTSWGQVLTKTGVYRDTTRYDWGCDSLVRTVDLKVIDVQTVAIDASVCGGSTYTMPWGQIVNAAGIYRDTLRSKGGCDSVRREVNLQVNKPVVNTIHAVICQGQSYTLPWGRQVSASGIYRDTLRHVAGCDSLIQVVELRVNTTTTQINAATICEGASYTLPWGEKVTEGGTYRDVIRFTGSSCDSLVREVTLRVTQKTVQNLVASVCEGKNYTLPWGPIVSAAGIYRDTVRTLEGCDSLVRSVDLAISRVAKTEQMVPLCEGSSYTLPSGLVVRSGGTFVDTLRAVNGGCDSLIRTIHVSLQTSVTNRTNATICAGESFSLPWGASVTAAGEYRDTLHYLSGCDSLIRVVNLNVNAAQRTIKDAAVCSGQDYTLPWGEVVTTAGTYQDTLRYLAGCDSLIRTVRLDVKTLQVATTAATICDGDSYALPWGGRASVTGLYSDTLRYASGCDSVIRSINLTVKSPAVNAFSVSLCAGQSYTLPTGQVVSTAGVFRDTVQYATGCDSLYRSITVLVNTPVVLDLRPSICSGESYTLPSGAIIYADGIYRDTVRQAAGCDSLYRTITLSIKTAQTQSLRPIICEGERYTLPWGGSVTASGIYRDTLRYAEGCDSLIRVVDLTVNQLTTQNSSITICEGSAYTLPWGPVVSSNGIYHDTLRYSTGCDSLIRTVDVRVNRVNIVSNNITLCQGESYTLPWGVTVSASGTYRDTLRYDSGCDSVRRTFTLSFRTAATIINKPSICVGELYTLPWGGTVSTAGSYRDTLRYTAGCDSIIRVVELSVKDFSVQSMAASICKGESYTLPWGKVITAPGTYRDTLYYLSGCDSVRRTVTLVVQEAQSLNTTATICSGDSYTLPWGGSVSSPGIYRDTLHYQSGCDSLIRTVNLTVQTKNIQSSSAILCEGQSYVLPWGQTVNTGGIYRDTLHYRTGCDSLIRVVELTMQRATTQATSPTICSGHSYTLPWGGIVATSGVYRDTLRYTTGCDSVIRVVNLSVTAAAQTTTSASICSDGWYTLPWGPRVNQSGVYRDTVRTSIGCDSLVRIVNLQVRQAPVLMLTKSNDIDCMLGTARLLASGATSYSWSPAASLNNTTSNSVVASPTSTTTYSVKAMATNGCTVEGSVEVKVTGGDPGKGYLVPNAFSPNGDGKNDCFGVRHWGAVKNFQLAVYNRWGEIVFTTTEVSKCWDGITKGKVEGSATFVYVITADTQCGKVLRKGYVNLIR